MEATISTVLHQIGQNGKLPCKIQSNSSPNSLPVAANLPSAFAKVKDRFPTIAEFMVAVNPDRQLQISEHPEVCYFGQSPTLTSLNVVYGHGPHVVRGVEVYKDRFVAYSLGNFCTPYNVNLTGISGYAPIIEITIGSEGAFKSGKIHSFLQSRGIGPREDNTGKVAKEIRQLSIADLPLSEAQIDLDGNITLKK